MRLGSEKIMSGIKRNLNGPYSQGVPNPYTAHVHPYPTRYHGAIYTRPTFGLPYVRQPHAVFKPDDFYSYYGVTGLGGLGSFGGSTLGGNSLGLGATGTPIYWHGFNPKTQALQGALNKVLVANQYREITVDGKLGAETCAALGICRAHYPEELASQVSSEIVAEAVKICNQVISQSSTTKADIDRRLKAMVANRDPIPPEPLVTQTEIVPASTAPIISEPPPAALPPVVAPPAPEPVPPYIAQPAPAPIEMEIPELMVEAEPPPEDHSKQRLAIGVALLVAGGAGYYVWQRNKKKAKASA
jgi:hypothetical protein